MSRPDFVRQLGPFTLVQRPPDPIMAQLTLHLGTSRTVGMATRNRLIDEILALVQDFDHLEVIPIPALAQLPGLSIGRVPECNVVLEDPSVSKQHAVLRWDSEQQGCTVADTGSSNGTFVNARELGREEIRLLADGDVVTFGDAQFMYFETGSLYEQLRRAAASRTD